MTYNQFFYYGSKPLGRSERKADLVHGQWLPPPSIAYFCQTCGEVWARVVVPEQPFRVWSMSCGKHQPPWRVCVAGSMLLDWDRDHNDSLPPEAWRQEVLTHCNWYERMQNVSF